MLRNSWTAITARIEGRLELIRDYARLAALTLTNGTFHRNQNG
jgi:hypothetical protein